MSQVLCIKCGVHEAITEEFTWGIRWLCGKCGRECDVDFRDDDDDFAPAEYLTDAKE